MPIGSILTRIHSVEFGVAEFNPTLAKNKFQGGRFDASPEDPYSFLYAASDDPTAISEALLRDLSIDDSGSRILPRAQIVGRQISWMRIESELQLVSLRSEADLALIGQDTWLTTSPANEYASTRRWCAAIRVWAPWACGMTWRSLREPKGFAFIFFGDRCPEGCFREQIKGLPVPVDDRALDSGAAHHYLNAILADYNVALMLN